MLLQVYGWSRYKWEYLSGFQKMENKYLLEKHLSVYGRVFFRGSKGFGNSYTSDPTQNSNSTNWSHSVGTYDDNPQLILDTNYIYIRNVWNDSLISEEDVITNYFELEKKFPFYRYKTDSKGQFHISFDDFYGETTVILSLFNKIINNKTLIFYPFNPFKYGFNGKFILTESESTPLEKQYSYFEINHPNINIPSYIIINGESVNQLLIDEIGISGEVELSFQPSIKTKHYIYSSRSRFTPRVIDWVFNRVNNSPLSSVETYERKHNDIKYSALYAAHNSVNNRTVVNASHLDFPSEYLKYYKLPLGTITTISNILIDTTNVDSLQISIITPKKNQSIYYRIPTMLSDLNTSAT